MAKPKLRKGGKLRKRQKFSKVEQTRNLEEIEKHYPVLKFAQEPLDEPLAVIVQGFVCLTFF